MVHVSAFIGGSLFVIVTPGQDTALTIRNTLLGGRPAGAFTALGVFAGQVCPGIDRRLRGMSRDREIA